MKLQLPGLYRRRHITVTAKPKAEHTGASSRSRWGQSTIEAALLLPFLILLLSVVIEAGLALSAWIRVNDAARDATRFAVDAGTASDVGTLVLSKLQGIDFGSSRSSSGSNNLNVYLIKGTTDNIGHISDAVWAADTSHVYGPGGAAARLAKATVVSKLAANNKNPDNIPFVIVEVDFDYKPLLGTLLSSNSQLPMTSYALIQQY